MLYLNYDYFDSLNSTYKILNFFIIKFTIKIFRTKQDSVKTIWLY